MDVTAFFLSLKLGALTVLILLPIGVAAGRFLAFRHFPARPLVEAFFALPLVLPPTVLGFYLLTAFGANAAAGRLWQAIFGHPLAFSFEGLLIASIIANLPFAVQPIQRGFEAIAPEVREAGACAGLRPLDVMLKIELPLAWPGIVTGLALTFAHTLGEFGVALMVGGNIAGETRTAAISIYDKVQAFDMQAAGLMSLVLLLISIVTLGIVYRLSARVGARYG